MIWKKYEVFFTDYGVWGRSPQEKGEAEKLEAL
jgi:hypothetical protein